MITLISPAKTLDFASPITVKETSKPLFMEEASEVMDILKELSPEDIAELMHISIKLAEENFFRFQNWNQSLDKNTRQAVLAFAGDVYKGLEPYSFTEEDIEFAQDNLRILSGLYGILRPRDLIKPYRLEMGIKLKNSKGENLYKFWTERITSYLNEEIKNHEDKAIINLASEEYSKAINFQHLHKDTKVIAPVFKEYRGGKYKIISIFAKKARGRMASYIIKNRIRNTEDIKKFNIDGYEFNKELSSENIWIFSR